MNYAIYSSKSISNLQELPVIHILDSAKELFYAVVCLNTTSAALAVFIYAHELFRCFNLRLWSKVKVRGSEDCNSQNKSGAAAGAHLAQSNGVTSEAANGLSLLHI